MLFLMHYYYMDVYKIENTGPDANVFKDLRYQNIYVST